MSLALGVRRRVFRAIMSAPPPILRLLSGGAGVHWRGRTLDPRLQYLHSLAGDEAEAGLGLPDRPASIAREPLLIETEAGLMAVTALRPLRQDHDLPVLVFVPGGGGLASDARACEALCAAIAETARSVVILVDPAMSDHLRPETLRARVRAVYRWANEAAARFGAPDGAVAIGGTAAGAVAAAALTRALKAEGAPQPPLLFLLSPTFADDDLAGDASDDDLAGLAPAVIAATGFDPAAEAAEDYARRLRAAGVSCHFRRYDTLAESFIAFTGVVPAAARAAREVVALAVGGLQSRYLPPETHAPPLPAPLRDPLDESPYADSAPGAAKDPVIIDRLQAFH